MAGRVRRGAAEFAEAAGLGSRFLGGTLVLRWAANGRRYFSRTIGLGVTEPATPEALDDVLDGYGRLGISMFLVQSLPHCEPPAYEDWLRERGLEPFDRQDRVVRGSEPPEPGGAGAFASRRSPRRRRTSGSTSSSGRTTSTPATGCNG